MTKWAEALNAGIIAMGLGALGLWSYTLGKVHAQEACWARMPERVEATTAANMAVCDLELLRAKATCSDARQEQIDKCHAALDKAGVAR